MISLSKDQPMATDENWLVHVAGEYQPDELVEVYNKNDPEQMAAYYALYIVTGEMP